MLVVNDSKLNRAIRRDKKIRKRKFGMRGGNRSTFTIVKMQEKRRTQILNKRRKEKDGD